MGSIGCKLWIVKIFTDFGNTIKKRIVPSKFILFIKYIKRVQLTVGVYVSVTTITLFTCDSSLPQIRHNGWAGHQYFFIKS